MDNKKKRILDEALYDTYAVSLEKGRNAKVQSIGALQEYMHCGETGYFTKTNSARDNIDYTFRRDELSMYMSEYLYEMSKVKVSESDLESEIFFEIKKQEMFFETKEDIIQIMADCMLGRNDYAFGFDYQDLATIAGKLYMDNEVSKIEKEIQELQKDIEDNIDPDFGIKNLDINFGAFNHCREEILRGTQIEIQNDLSEIDPTKKARRVYNLNDELMAVTDIGNIKTRQEDSVLILYHPRNPDYKMLVVADGMGGSKDGHLASTEIVTQMIGWFENLPTEYMEKNNDEYLRKAWAGKLSDISEDILRKHPGSLSTFVGAIVGEKTTTIASAGDSRAYILGNDNELYQMTVDDNVEFQAWNREWTEREKTQDVENNLLLKMAKSTAKDDLRFRRDSNFVTNGLGLETLPQINFSSVENDKYKTLMLFSDGVTDCLSDKQIMAITKNTKPNEIAAALVNEAMSNVSYKPELVQSENHNIYISAGKDNTTAAVYNNTKEGDER